jgi:subtilase family serine protease
VRDLPDISLFASNGFWSHALLLCMSDPNEGGSPCDYANPLDTFFNSAGGTSFTAPQFAGIQALINQKAGGPQGNPDPIYYDLAKSEYSSIFHDVTVGNNDVPCYGTNDCYLPSGNEYGVLSTSDTHLSVAYPAHSNWDFATGLGSVNVTDLVNRWP